MFELIDTQPDIEVQASEYHRLLGYPRHHTIEGRARELADLTREWYSKQGRPWIYGLEASLEVAGDIVRVGGEEFFSKPLLELSAAAQAHGAVLVAVSAGPECEEKAREAWQEGKPDEYFFMEMYGSAVVEHLITLASGRICGWADQNQMAVLPHSSPGYSGWDVSGQISLWNRIRRDLPGVLPGPLEVLDTGMLRPKKSLLAVFGLTRHLGQARQLAKLIPCENCALPRCQYRRKSYRRAPPQIEEVDRLQAHRRAAPDHEARPIPPLTHDAKYSVGVKAMQKWSRERLRLTFQEDGSVHAHFRYEGTTCTNLGRALEFDYLVQLGSREDGYRILEVGCAPASGDTGHTLMCEYLNNAGGLMRQIAAEKPLLGRPLDEVLAWERPANPSGCYCGIDRRLHKWGLVLDVIHYALAQRERELVNGQADAILK